MSLIEYLSQPWHWSISGVLLALIMLLLLWFGGEFGVSSNLRTFCTLGGAGKLSPFFNFEWKKQLWNIAFLMGAPIGGYISLHYLSNPDPINLSPNTTNYLSGIGISFGLKMNPEYTLLPEELFSLSGDSKLSSFLYLISGGILIGFGSRYAGGCTSGHAISGLANLQISSLIAVVGFFIGGLIMTWLILPILLTSIISL